MSKWNLWVNELAKHLEYTLNAYLSINVHVYIIQQTPVHKHITDLYQFYKWLLDRNNLTDASLRESSLTRSKYVEQQIGVEKVFAKFKNRRGVTFIYIEDLACDEKYCPVGTGEMPYYSDFYHLTHAMAHRLKARIFGMSF
jgi:hypothetical protein